MVKKELIEKSPLRILEKSIHGGVGPGNIGVIAGCKGIGKTACLVHIATDKLLQERHVVHVSFSKKADHIVSWYEDIFGEISKRRNLEHAMEVHDSLVKYRLIMNFANHPASIDHVINRVRSMGEFGHFSIDCIIMDGFDFYADQAESLRRIKEFAREAGCEIWFSASLATLERAENNIPKPLDRYLDVIDVIVVLTPGTGSVSLDLVKDHATYPVDKLRLSLDPRVLLITEE